LFYFLSLCNSPTATMADACFTARATTREHVRKAIKKLALSKNSNGQFNHDVATNFKAAVIRVLKSTFNPINPGCGMSGLCTKASTIAKIKTTSVATIQSALNDATANALATSTPTNTAPPWHHYSIRCTRGSGLHQPA
jgi:hypothetical protein